MSNLKSVPFNESVVKTELDKARARPSGTPSSNHGLGTAAEYRAQAADYDSIAETEPILSWESRLKLARAASALRAAADSMEVKA